MPVIREKVERRPLAPDQRERLRRGLVEELTDATATAGGPVLFEIPIDGSDQFDVIAVWDAWEGVHEKDRTTVTAEAYHAAGREPSLAMGVTVEEAKERGLLPYRVKLFSGDLKAIPEDQVAIVSRRHGGFPLPNGKYEFRFPTEKIALQVAQELQRDFPNTRWAVPSFGLVEYAGTEG